MLDTNNSGVTSNGEACRKGYLWRKRDFELDVLVVESGIDLECHSFGADVSREDLELSVCYPYLHGQVHLESRNTPSICIHETLRSHLPLELIGQEQAFLWNEKDKPLR